MKDKIVKFYNDALAQWVKAPYWARACVWVLVGFVVGLAI